MLIQIANTYILGPFYLAFVRHQFVCNNIHECGLTFTVGADQTDMLTF